MKEALKTKLYKYIEIYSIGINRIAIESARVKEKKYDERERVYTRVFLGTEEITTTRQTDGPK